MSLNGIDFAAAAQAAKAARPRVFLIQYIHNVVDFHE